MVGTTEIPLDTPVVLSGMWIRNVRIQIQNQTPKPIVKCGLTLLFPEIKPQGNDPVPSVGMGGGRVPEHALTRRDGTVQKLSNLPPPEIEIAPGSTMEFKSFDTTNAIRSFGPSQAGKLQAQSDALATAIQDQVYNLAGHLSKVNIILDSIYFGDGSKWVGGHYYEAAPSPQLWQEVTSTQFFAGQPIPPQ